MFCARGEVDAELFHHPIKTLGHHPCLFVPRHTLRIEGTKGFDKFSLLIYLAPGTLLPIFYESLCDFVSMTNCLLLSSCRNLCHNAVNLWLAIPLLVVASSSMKSFFSRRGSI
jgi:hypothetical protein